MSMCGQLLDAMCAGCQQADKTSDLLTRYQGQSMDLRLAVSCSSSSTLGQAVINWTLTMTTQSTVYKKTHTLCPARQLPMVITMN